MPITKRCEYLIADKEIFSKRLSDIATYCQGHTKKVIGKIEIRELAGIPEYPNGIYLFYKSKGQQDELVYVGRAKSRSFIERLPSHFDSREDAWFNSLTKKVREHEKLDSYQDAIPVALSLKVLLIGVHDKSLVNQLESIFRSFLAPRYNSTRSRYSNSGAIRLKELVGAGDKT